MKLNSFGFNTTIKWLVIIVQWDTQKKLIGFDTKTTVNAIQMEREIGQ